jgi:hypothetical protein
MQIVNWTLAKQPVNWLTIGMMLFIAAMFGHLFLSYLGVEPATADDSGS